MSYQTRMTVPTPDNSHDLGDVSHWNSKKKKNPFQCIDKTLFSRIHLRNHSVVLFTEVKKNKIMYHSSDKIILICHSLYIGYYLVMAVLCGFYYIYCVTATPQHVFLPAFVDSNSCNFNLGYISQPSERNSILHVCVELFQRFFHKVVLSRLVLGN